MRRKTGRWLVTSVVMAMVLAVPGVALADTSSTIDFEGLSAGDIVSSLSAGNGISGGDAGGSVGVFGHNPTHAPSNAAMIFDATCSGDISLCTGLDDDLYVPAFGNVLIISQDLDSSDPDDDGGSENSLAFDFSTWGPGVVQIGSVDVVDVDGYEPNGVISVYSGGPGGTLEGTFPIPVTGDGGTATINIGLSDVDYMLVEFDGSSAVDNIEITVLEETASARVTGGGHQFTMVGTDNEQVRVTRGFTLHCDITLSNNLEINWRGNKWHIDKFVDDAFCYDDPAYDPDPPPAPADTYVGLDAGRLNGDDGSVACWVFEDHGEPGKEDRAMIHIWEAGYDPGITDLTADNPCGEPGEHTVLYVPLSELKGGNVQFHYDQPHK